MFKKSKFALVAVAALLLAGCGGGTPSEFESSEKNPPVSSEKGSEPSSEKGSEPSSEKGSEPSSEGTSQPEIELEKALTIKVTGLDVKSTVAKNFKPDAARESYRLSVWSEVESHPLFIEVLKEFVKKFAYDPDNNVVYEFNIRIGDQYAAAATEILADVSLAPNVFGYPDDQVEQLVNGNVLAELTGGNKEWAVSNNIASSISSGTFNNKLYAYPQTADNGYFLYYNSNYLTLEDVSSFDSILAKLKELSSKREDNVKYKIVLPFEDAWYIPSFFFHNHTDDPTAAPAFSYDPTTKAMKTTIDDEKGQNSARGMDRILSEENQAYINAIDVNDAAELFATVDADGKPREPEALLGVTGTWNGTPTLKPAMGDGYAATKLPTFKPVAADGTLLPDQQMGSFAGSKLISVTIQEDPMKLFFSHQIAQMLTSQETQVKRFVTQGFGPSNIEAQKDPAVLADVAISALNLQNQFAVSQSRSVSGSFWDPTAAFGKTVVSQDYGEENKTVIDFLNQWATAIRTVPEAPEK